VKPEFGYEAHVFESSTLRRIVEEAIEFFECTPVRTLQIPGFPGCGVYALYYLGAYSAYRSLAETNRIGCTAPIYVGKAVPPGRRKGRGGSLEARALYARLREHARSIEQGAGLGVDDFRCRFVILRGSAIDLVVPVESELIRRHRPLWNTVVDGFGNHDPGSGRYDQAPSEWDALHRGRPWVHRLTGDAPDVAGILEKVKQRLAESLPS
jgi:hypothetical protein